MKERGQYPDLITRVVVGRGGGAGEAIESPERFEPPGYALFPPRSVRWRTWHHRRVPAWMFAGVQNVPASIG
ncbi:MAG: hypothetical protein IPK44_19415 [Candidatus Accumulibacter sp.]|uniref:hypothetical protein n=1 Tax=Accumulibacter sp. TaxID=2053492 RepID=UPI002588712C|nr:hypothetical protein [Accumulibacter sp.]MBK8116505.1 hypothetical protein [Accumulibacter sp.]